MKVINIKNGMPLQQLIELLKIGEPFQLDGEKILHFTEKDISLINKEKLKAQQQENAKMDRVSDQHALDSTLDNIHEVGGVELSGLEKKLLLAGETITIGTKKVSFKDGALTIEPPRPKLKTPKQKM